MTSRRSALASILAACSAPFFVPVERLMRLKPIVVPRPLDFAMIQEAIASMVRNQSLDDLLRADWESQCREYPGLRAAGDEFIRSLWEPSAS